MTDIGSEEWNDFPHAFGEEQPGRDDQPRQPCQLDIANEALQSFAPETAIVWHRRGWFVVWTRRVGGVDETVARRWMTRGQDFFPVWHRSWAHGGTACTALSQLVRWLQGKPVLPIVTWRYWAGPVCRLLPMDAVDRLLAGGYPEHAKCVLCGKMLTGSLDWWSLNRVSGPCCSWTTGCRQRDEVPS